MLHTPLPTAALINAPNTIVLSRPAGWRPAASRLLVPPTLKKLAKAYWLFRSLVLYCAGPLAGPAVSRPLALLILIDCD